MSNWSSTQLTDLGRALDAKVTAGTTQLSFTKMKLGSGTESDEDIPAMTDLVSPELVLGISSCAVSASDDTVCELISVASSSDVEDSFVVRELGVFATDPDVGEILYAVMLDSTPDTMPNENVSSPVTVTYQVNIVSANASSITAVIDPAGLVTASVLQGHNDSISAHKMAHWYRQNSKVYAVGDIAFSASLPSSLVLECTTEGTTAATAPDFSGAVEGDTITDGRVVWTYRSILSGGGGVPVGFIMPYAGTGLQEGWLDCDGSAVSRTMYPDLFTAIGTTWGAGDGSTTFNLPRSEDLVMQGASATNPVGTYLQAGLPNITGTFGQPTTEEVSPTATGAFEGTVTTGGRAAGSGGNYETWTFDASRSSAIYGNSSTVQSPAACVRYMIKAFDGQTLDSALIDITQYASDLANKATRSLDNLNATGEARFAHVVIDSYYDSTTGDWWRKYADGWLEQGGIKDTTGIATNNVSVSLLLPMSDSNYSIQANTVSGQAMTTGSGTVNLNTTNGCAAALNRCSTTGFYINYAQATTASGFGNVVWRVCGMGASV